MRRRSKIASTAAAIGFLVLGFVVRPFVESVSKRVGENIGDRIVAPKDRASANLTPSLTQAAAYKVAVINRTNLPNEVIQHVVKVLATQVSRDLAPVWGVDAQLRFVKNGEAPAPDEWWLEILGTSDIGDAIAYHEMTPEGLPRAKIFTETAKQGKASWTAAASHELISMLVNPRTNLTVIGDPQTSGKAYALEIPDPCQADTYKIDGVEVSDFVFPAWFDPTRSPNSTQFDFLRLIDRPLTLRPGGYVITIGPNLKQDWQTIYAKSGA
jgi:hypothetical protein